LHAIASGCKQAGITGLTKTLAKEWGPLGVRANAIAFGKMETRMTSVGPSMPALTTAPPLPGMIETRMTSAFAEDAAVTVGGEAIPQVG
jgi:NAD(P)-dependent dehydrogenase (short-subunit alcohol dehydrogenase family)